jgi:hypothetical protein
MGLEPTTFCMASKSWVFGLSLKALQIGYFRASVGKHDARRLPAIHGDLANHWQTVCAPPSGSGRLFKSDHELLLRE